MELPYELARCASMAFSYVAAADGQRELLDPNVRLNEALSEPHDASLSALVLPARGGLPTPFLRCLFVI